MSDPTEVAASSLDVIFAEVLENVRTVMPIHVTTYVPGAGVIPATCEGSPAVPGQLPDGSAGVPELLSERPVWYPGGAGFFIHYPLIPTDLALGLVSDRSLAAWSLSRLPGPQSAPTFPHYHNISDTQVLPFTDTPGVPDGDPGVGVDFMIGGPAGTAIRITTLGEVTISTAAATVTIAVDGTITLDGTSIEGGGVGALALAKAQALSDAIDAMLAGGTPTPNDGGAGLKATMTTAWNLVKASFATTKMKGV